MDTTLADLSPYYLQEARRNMKYWADMRAPGQVLGGADGTGTSYLQAPAEAISQPDNSYDVVRMSESCVASPTVAATCTQPELPHDEVSCAPHCHGQQYLCTSKHMTTFGLGKTNSIRL